jgi:AcrR family transcriptional regulator
VPSSESREPMTQLSTVAPPKQARSELTLQRILDAAEALIGEKGLADASIPEIVRRARSSVGGFYARFRDKDELLRALEERFIRQITARVGALADARRWTHAPLPVIVEALGRELVSVVRERRNLIAAFLHRATRDPASLLEAARFRADVTRRVATLLLQRRDALHHPDPELAIDLGVQFAFALMLQLVLVGEVKAAGRVLSDLEIQREIARNFLAYIGVGPVGPPPSGDPA